jgi:hypothetical protein
MSNTIAARNFMIPFTWLNSEYVYLDTDMKPLKSLHICLIQLNIGIMLMIKLTIDETLLSGCLGGLTDNVKDHDKRITTLEERQALLDFESTNMTFLTDRLFDSL